MECGVGEGEGEGADGVEERAVAGVTEVLRPQVADVGAPVRLEEERAEEGLFGVVRGPGRGQVGEAGVGTGRGCGVGHQAAREKSPGVTVVLRCGASRWAASRGGTALPIWVKRWL